MNAIAEIYDGTHQTPEYKDSGIPFISVENIDDIYSSKKFISNEAYNQYKIKPQLGDLFMTRIGSIGKCAVMNKEMDLAYYVSLALIRPNQQIINTRYLKHFIESTQGKKELSKRTLHHAVPIKVNKDDVGKIEIAFPTLEIQERIVNVLDNFDSICTDLKIGLPAEIEARKKQYEYYRDLLLTFDTIHMNGGGQSRSDEIKLLQYVFGYAIVRLGEISELYAGATPSTSKSEYWENGTIPWMSSGEVNLGQVYDTEKKITQKGFDNCSTKMIPANTVVVALAGQGKTRGTVAITRIPLCTNQSLCSIVTKDFVDSYFLYFYLKGQYQKLRSISSGDGTRGGVNLKMLREFEIILPAFEEQERIVKILDRFDSLCNDISSGLPAEIEARQKQYEYYRDKLLTFEEKEV